MEGLPRGGEATGWRPTTLEDTAAVVAANLDRLEETTPAGEAAVAETALALVTLDMVLGRQPDSGDGLVDRTAEEDGRSSICGVGGG